MKKIVIKIVKIFQSSMFRKWFLLLLGSFAGLVFCFTVYTYHYFKVNLQSEFTSYSKLLTERIAASVDASIDNAKQIMYSLDSSSNVTVYMNQKDASLIFSDIHNRLASQLSAYAGSLDYIDSIYLYSAASQSIATNESLVPKALSIFDDINWMNSLSQASDDPYLLFARKKNDLYPYLLTMLKPMTSANTSGAIVMNLDLSQITFLSSYDTDLVQDIYIISDEGKILYEHVKNAINNIKNGENIISNLKNYRSRQRN